jgi:hypothetical protein
LIPSIPLGDRRWSRDALLWVGVLLVLTGCSSYTALSEKTRPHLVARDYERALAELDETPSGPDAVLVHLERGLLLHYDRRFDASNQAFEAAEVLIDELYTRSLTNEGLALVTSDNVRPYDGAEFERVMVHFYRALNYVGLGLTDDALVEARKANLALDLYTRDLDDPAYGDDPFLQYVTGLLYEWGGEVNDGYVSYKKAEEAYRAGVEDGGPSVPTSLTRGLIRLAEWLGFVDEASAWRERYPEADPDPLSAEMGEVLLVVETGFVPPLEPVRVDIPILKTDRRDHDSVYHVAGSAVHRIGRYERGDTSIAYWLSIAYPVLSEVPPSVAGVTLEADDLVRPLEVVSDLRINARRNFQDRQSTILIRTIARGLLKYLSKQQAEKEVGKGAGILVNLLGALTEQADVRSWRNLPYRIYLTRVPLPAGTHDLVVTAEGRGPGALDRVRLEGVEVRAGATTWLTYRFFE